MIDLLGEIIGAIGEAVFSWRFYLCFGIAIAVIAAIHWFVPVSPWRQIASAVVGALALTVAIIWEHRAA
jgi:hypothetical protein